MADTSKPNSVAGKVVSGSPTPNDGLDNLGKAIGARAKVTTTLNQNYEGIVFTVCTTLNVVAISTASKAVNSKTKSEDYHIIPISKIQSFSILTPGSGDGTFATAQPPIAPVDTRHAQIREEKRVMELKEELSHINPDVSAEGQEIYNNFKKIGQPIRWHNNQIIVYDAVIISPPYNVEDCKAPANKTEQLNRVKKILEGERKKIMNRAGVPTGPRKGG